MARAESSFIKLDRLRSNNLSFSKRRRKSAYAFEPKTLAQVIQSKMKLRQSTEKDMQVHLGTSLPRDVSLAQLGQSGQGEVKMESIGSSIVDSDSESVKAPHFEDYDASVSQRSHQSNQKIPRKKALYIQLIKYLIHWEDQRIIQRDVFQFGVEPLLKMDAEGDVVFTVQELQQSLEKSKRLVTLFQERLEFKKFIINTRLKDALYDYAKVSALKANERMLEEQVKRRIEDQQKVQEWLMLAIQQNVGVFHAHGRTLVYAAKSLGLFSHENRFRRLAVWITEASSFDSVVMGLILVGSVCQALTDYSDVGVETRRNQNLEAVTSFTGYCFIVECFLRVVAQGLYRHKSAYLRSGFNVVDFLVAAASAAEIVTSWLPNSSSVPSARGLRALRVLRPLRSIRRVPRLRRIVSILLRSLPELGNTLVFLAFFFLVFGIVGIQTFRGAQYQRCRLTPEPVGGRWEIDPAQRGLICTPTAGEYSSCQKGTYCGSPVDYKLDPVMDEAWDDPGIRYDAVNFNDLLSAGGMIFEALTLEGWAEQLYNLQDAGHGTFAVFFYLMLVAFGSYFVLNLILAVIMASFSKQENQEIVQRITQAQDEELRRVKSGNILDQPLAAKAGDDSELGKRCSHRHQSLAPGHGLADDRSQESVDHRALDRELLEDQEEGVLSLSVSFGSSAGNSQVQSKLDLVLQDSTAVARGEKEMVGRFSTSPAYQTELRSAQRKREEYKVPSENADAGAIEEAGSESRQDQHGKVTREKTALTGPQPREDLPPLEVSDDELPLPPPQNRLEGRVEARLSFEGGEVVDDGAISPRGSLSSAFADSVPGNDQGGLGKTTYSAPLACLAKAMRASRTAYAETRLRKFFYAICSSRLFSAAILVTILLNTISLSSDRYPIDPEEAAVHDQINSIATWIYVGELIVKVLGLGLVTYALDALNQFDALIVVLSMVELVLQSEEKDNRSGGQILSIFRAFRLLRVFRLARQWSSFHQMMVKIAATLKDVFTFFLLLLIAVFVLALLGVELYANQVKFDSNNRPVPSNSTEGVSPRLNFDSFLHGTVSVFVCLIGEDWQLIMHDVIRATGQGLWAGVFFVSLMVVGNLFLMNLFLAILLKNFEVKEGDDGSRRGRKQLSVGQLKLSISFRMRNSLHNLRVRVQRLVTRDQPQQETELRVVEMKAVTREQSRTYPGAESLSMTAEEANEASRELEEGELGGGPRLKQPPDATDSPALGRSKALRVNRRGKAVVRRSSDALGPPLRGHSMQLFGPDHPLRVRAARVVLSSNFELFIFALVVCSSVLMALEDPLEEPSLPKFEVIKAVNDGITYTFLAEVLLRVFVQGLIDNGPDSYLRNGWNILDFFIVVVSLVSLILEDTTRSGQANVGTGGLELLKMLRVLRCLRLFSRNEGLKLSLLSLIYSAPGIFNVTVVSALFLQLAGIFFLNLLKGKLWRCHFPDAAPLLDRTAIVTRFDCVNLGGHWENQYVNFDDIPNAMFALFTMCTTEGWVAFMFNGADAVGIGFEPQRNYSPAVQAVFIFFMFFGSLLITNLFIEVVINTFHKEKSKIDKNYLLTAFQSEWVYLQLKCYDCKPKTKVQTNNRIRLVCLKIAEYEYFDNFIMLLILINAFTLAFVWVNIDPKIEQYNEFLQQVFNVIFMAECALKLIAYNSIYFQSGWNRFDFVIVVGGTAGLLTSSTLASQLTLVRLLRVGRLFRLIKKFKSLNIIFSSFIRTIPLFVSVGGTISVMIFIFSTVGTRLFALTKFSGALTRHSNFQSFRESVLTLIVVATGEGWYTLLESLARERSVDFDCIENPTYEDLVASNYEAVGCGSPRTAAAFFGLYVYSVGMILINLFIAVTLQGFSDVMRADNCRITDYQLQSFIDIWSDFDPDGSGYIGTEEFRQLVGALLARNFELFADQTREDLESEFIKVDELVSKLDLKLCKDYTCFQFNDILTSLSQLYLYALASQEPELTEHLIEFHRLNLSEVGVDLDEVLEQLEDLQRTTQVQLCKQLDQKELRFKKAVQGSLEGFEGGVYSSKMIPRVTSIQRHFRARMRQVRSRQESEAKARARRPASRALDRLQEHLINKLPGRQPNMVLCDSHGVVEEEKHNHLHLHSGPIAHIRDKPLNFNSKAVEAVPLGDSLASLSSQRPLMQKYSTVDGNNTINSWKLDASLWATAQQPRAVVNRVRAGIHAYGRKHSRKRSLLRRPSLENEYFESVPKASNAGWNPYRDEDIDGPDLLLPMPEEAKAESSQSSRIFQQRAAPTVVRLDANASVLNPHVAGNSRSRRGQLGPMVPMLRVEPNRSSISNSGGNSGSSWGKKQKWAQPHQRVRENAAARPLATLGPASAQGPQNANAYGSRQASSQSPRRRQQN